ncbi:hypothetical protein KP509_37G053900 [Ceratopteris richardii]|nr:hypothetical protein KP509_37G053900 [Ceratopteris richardii]
MAIFTNTNLLKHANVDTFIVFRSSTPLLVAIADTVFRKQPWPSRSTFLSLFLILAGAIGYVLSDSAFSITAYSWAVAYLIVITTEMVYVKHIVSSIGLNTWGLVLYNNFISLIMSPIFFIVSNEISEVREAFTRPGELLKLDTILSVSLSCAFGLAISFFGFACRREISATAFTVTGVVNKFLTVILNVLIWDKHASESGLFYLVLTLVGGVMYQQSTVKESSLSSSYEAYRKQEKEGSETDGSDTPGLPTDEETGLLSTPPK